MGPTILLDKSPFQKCPKSLLPELFRHYSLVVPSILLNEILEDHAESPDKFLALARRLDCIDIGINVDYRGMVEGELLGYTVPMEGRACLAGSAVSTDEGLLHVLKETPEEKALHRWQRGYVSPEEKEMAARWQDSSAGFDMEGFAAKLRKEAVGLPKFSGEKHEALVKIVGFVDKLLGLPNQRQFLELVLLDFNDEFRTRVRGRWEQLRPNCLKAFAPYAHYCLRLRYVFALGLINGHLSTHHNSLLDLDYLYYLPFCQIFCSDDKRLHGVMQLALLRPDQTFWDYRSLERALDETNFFFKELGPEGLKKWLKKKSHYPPPGSSLTCKMYGRYWKVPKELRGNFAEQLPKELVESVLRKVRAAREKLGPEAPANLTIIDPGEPDQRNR